MTRYAYCRVSTVEQNLDRQIEAVRTAGVEPENVYQEKVSDALADRPELDRLLDTLQPGDALVVASFDRLARSTRQLLELSERLQEADIGLVSLKEAIDTSTPQGRLFFTISAAFAEFERDVIRERQAEGIAIAKAKGKYKGGRPRCDQAKLDAAIKLYLADKCMSVREIAKAVGLSHTSIYREIKARGVER